MFTPLSPPRIGEADQHHVGGLVSPGTLSIARTSTTETFTISSSLGSSGVPPSSSSSTPSITVFATSSPTDRSVRSLPRMRTFSG